MNTFSYVSSWLSPAPSPPPPASLSTSTLTVDDDAETTTVVDEAEPGNSTTATPTVDLTSDPELDEPSLPPPTTAEPEPESESETIYLSARLSPTSTDPPLITLSSTPPPHLVGRMEALRRERATVDRDEGDLHAHETAVDEEGAEEKEGERRLQMKRQELASREKETEKVVRRSGSGAGGRLLWAPVSMYIFLRRLLAWVGVVPYSGPRSSYNALLAPHAEITVEKPSIDSPSPDTDLPTPSPTPTRTSFLRPSPPPPLPKPRLTPKTLVLDLDETLIHSTSRPHASSYRNSSRAGLKMRVVEVHLEGRSTVYTVWKRPWVDFFLRKVSTWYTIIIFTASLPEYADPVIDWLDGGDGRGGMIHSRLFRSDCVFSGGSYVKDLSTIGDLKGVCLVDNSPVSYAINQANGIPIEGWINDPADECLLDLLPMLDSLRFTSDVRRVLGLRGFRGENGGRKGEKV